MNPAILKLKIGVTLLFCVYPKGAQSFMKKTLLSLAAVSGLFLAACTKDSTTTNPNTVRQMLLGKWEMTYSKKFVILNGKTDSETDSFAALDSCAKDNLLVFQSDSTYWGDQGDIKCFPFKPQQEKIGSWLLQNNDQELILRADSPVRVTRSRILELSATQLKLYQDSTTSDKGIVASTKILTIYQKK